MRRVFILAIVLMLSAISAVAQYGTDKIRMPFKVRYLPDVYVPEGDRVYNVSCALSREIAEFVNPQTIIDSLQIGDDWVFNDNPNYATLRMNVEAFDFFIEKIHPFEVTEIVKERGQEVSRTYFMPHIDYSLVINYSFTIFGQTRTVTNCDTYTKKPPIASFTMDKRFRNKRDCQDFIHENKGVLLDKILHSELLAIVDKMQDEITADFRYYSTTDFIKVAFFDSKKNPNYEKHRNGKWEVKNIFAAMPLEGPLTKTIKDLQPWIQHFKDLEESLSMTDKKQRSAKSDMVYNLAMIYYALEIFDVSREYATRLQNEFGDNDGKRIIKDINKLEADLKKHHLLSRHF